MITEKCTYSYSCYGLNILSDFRLPELTEKKFANPDVAIIRGKVKEKYTDEHVPEGLHFESIDCLIFKMACGTFFQVSGGKLITIQFPEHAEEGLRDLLPYMMSSVFNALLHQRGILLIHAGVYCRHARSIAIAGESGIGKSTVGAEFCLRRGYSFLSDDVCAIDGNNESKIVVLQSVPRLKMLPDAMQRMGLNCIDFEAIHESNGKFAISVKDRLPNGEVYLDVVFILTPKTQNDVEVTSLKGIEKMESLLNNLFWIEYLRWMGNQKSLFAKCNAICQNIRIYRLTFDKRVHSPQLLADIIEESLILA